MLKACESTRTHSCCRGGQVWLVAKTMEAGNLGRTGSGDCEAETTTDIGVEADGVRPRTERGATELRQAPAALSAVRLSTVCGSVEGVRRRCAGAHDAFLSCSAARLLRLSSFKQSGPVGLNLSVIPFQRNNNVLLSHQISISINISCFFSQPYRTVSV